MRFLPQTMVGRMIALAFVCILLLQGVGGYLHFREWRDFNDRAERTQLIERMAVFVQWMNAASPLERQFLLRTNPPFRMKAWLSPRADLDDDEAWFGVESLVKYRLIETLGGVDERRVQVEIKDSRRKKYRHFHDDDDDDDDEDRRYLKQDRAADPRLPRELLLVSVQLNDGIWLTMVMPYRSAQGLPPFLMTFGVLTLIAVLALAFMMKRTNKPLMMMAQAAQRLGRDVNAPPMEEEGPREVREAAHAFNEMQRNLQRFVQDRTTMVAAISHDLRTPITRMRLRAELVDDEEDRQKMLDDLAEMEAMIAATMDFARDDVAHEKSSALNLAALVETVCEDRAELGGDVSYHGPDTASFMGRPIGLKRALGNLVDNALKYGKRCDVYLEESATDYIIRVCDEGEGIDSDKLEAMFRPFQRGESSRNRETGGVGLGLAIVRSVSHAHGGQASLHNRPEGGLEARLILPRA